MPTRLTLSVHSTLHSPRIQLFLTFDICMVHSIHSTNVREWSIFYIWGARIMLECTLRSNGVEWELFLYGYIREPPSPLHSPFHPSASNTVGNQGTWRQSLFWATIDNSRRIGDSEPYPVPWLKALDAQLICAARDSEAASGRSNEALGRNQALLSFRPLFNGPFYLPVKTNNCKGPPETKHNVQLFYPPKKFEDQTTVSETCAEAAVEIHHPRCAPNSLAHGKETLTLQNIHLQPIRVGMQKGGYRLSILNGSRIKPEDSKSRSQA